MPGLAELARKRLVSWMDANRKITQTMIAREIGVSQSWVSLYRSGDQDADIDQLAAMARVFDHTLYELLDLRPNPKEQELIDAYRRLTPEDRVTALKVVEAMSPSAPPERRSKRRGE